MCVCVLLGILDFFFTLGTEPRWNEGVMEACEVIQQMLHLFTIQHPHAQASSHSTSLYRYRCRKTVSDMENQFASALLNCTYLIWLNRKCAAQVRLQRDVGLTGRPYLVLIMSHYRMCVSECPSGFFRDDRKRCKKCSSLCETCVGSRSDQCTTCRAGFHLNEGSNTCVANCVDGFYLDHGTLLSLFFFSLLSLGFSFCELCYGSLNFSVWETGAKFISSSKCCIL